MATIRKRGDLQWQAIVRRTGYPQTSKTFLKKCDADQWARETESAMKKGLWIDNSEAERTSLTVALERYRKEITSQKKGWEKEASVINNIKSSPLSKFSLAYISGGDIAEYRDMRLAEVGPKTVQNELSLLQHLFNIAMREWRMPLPAGNPVLAVRKPSPARARDRRLVGDEETRLLDAAALYGGCIKTVIVLALETAMRRGEIASLVWKDIDLKRYVIRLDDTKNGERRDVPLSSQAIKSLT